MTRHVLPKSEMASRTRRADASRFCRSSTSLVRRSTSCCSCSDSASRPSSSEALPAAACVSSLHQGQSIRPWPEQHRVTPHIPGWPSGLAEKAPCSRELVLELLPLSPPLQACSSKRNVPRVKACIRRFGRPCLCITTLGDHCPQTQVAALYGRLVPLLRAVPAAVPQLRLLSFSGERSTAARVARVPLHERSAGVLVPAVSSSEHL